MTDPITLQAAVVDEAIALIITEAKTALVGRAITYDESLFETNVTKSLNYLLDRSGVVVEGREAPTVEAAEPEEKRELVIGTKVPKNEDGFYNSPEFLKTFTWFVESSRAGRTTGTGLIVGPTGAGKTESVIRLAKQLDVPCYVMDMAANTTSEKFLGHKEVDASGTHYIQSEFLRWVQGEEVEPGIVVLDEVTRTPPVNQNVLFGLMDNRDAVFVPDMHVYIRKHPQTVFVATANIGGQFTGTFRMDAAFRSRFAYTWERDFPPHDAEVKVIVARTGLDAKWATKLVDVATLIRKKANSGDLTDPVSTRQLLNAARLMADGASIEMAFDLCILPFYEKTDGTNDQRTLVRGILTGKVR
jgi:hypothetical protein